MAIYGDYCIVTLQCIQHTSYHIKSYRIMSYYIISCHRTHWISWHYAIQHHTKQDRTSPVSTFFSAMKSPATQSLQVSTTSRLCSVFFDWFSLLIIRKMVRVLLNSTWLDRHQDRTYNVSAFQVRNSDPSKWKKSRKK